jgi:serine/threonine protein phosphatase PrpC
MLLSAQELPDTDSRSAAVWCDHRKVGRDWLASLAVLTQARPGLGEDAEPTVLYHRPSRHGLIGVYDGLGGAGARPAGRTGDERVLSNAFVAARLAHLTVREWFVGRVSGSAEAELRSMLARVLTDARRGRTKLGGTLRRDLPTTVALIEHERLTHRRVRVTTRWAGDSRCYVLRHDQGLQQLSQDDSEVDDALQVLIADQPMTNVVSANGDFRINVRVLEVDLPCVLVCATDGFFNYVDSPALFEYHVLDCLLAADDLPGWARLLVDRVRGYTADDASLALVALGYSGVAQLRDGFRPRHDRLRREHYTPLAGLDPGRDRERFVQARADSWQRYRPDYSHYIVDSVADEEG